MDEQNIDIDICSFEKDTPCTKQKRAAHRPPNINIISQGMRACLCLERELNTITIPALCTRKELSQYTPRYAVS